MLLIIIITLFLTLFITFFSYYLIAFWTGAPYLPTPNKIVREMISVAHIKKGDNIADLGSGDARILIAAAQKRAYSTGWEINPILVLWSIIKVNYLGLGKYVVIHCNDYRMAQLKVFDKIFLYSISDKIVVIEKKILTEMRKGSLVISYKFALPNLKLNTKTASGIYVYKV